MKILDSNLIIYSARLELEFLRVMIWEPDVCLSIVSKIETLGYSRLTTEERQYFTDVFNSVALFSIFSEIIDKAIELRQQRRMSLGDAIIAATALLNGLSLYTRNTADFTHIPGLTVINPIDR